MGIPATPAARSSCRTPSPGSLVHAENPGPAPVTFWRPAPPRPPPAHRRVLRDRRPQTPCPRGSIVAGQGFSRFSDAGLDVHCNPRSATQRRRGALERCRARTPDAPSRTSCPEQGVEHDPPTVQRTPASARSAGLQGISRRRLTSPCRTMSASGVTPGYLPLPSALLLGYHSAARSLPRCLSEHLRHSADRVVLSKSGPHT